MGKRILLAEDHLKLAETITSLLSRQGLQPSHVANGADALRTIAKEPPDLLLLDLKLPGLHGIELLKKLRQSPLTAKLPVIILTGVYKGEKFHQAAKALGVRHYIEKPFKAAALLDAIRQELNSGTEPSQSAEARPFAQHLRTAFLKRFSGQALLRFHDTPRTIIFINGAPVALRPGFKHRDFGDYLRNQSRITDQEYDYYSTRGGFRNDCLVKMGCLYYSDLLRAELEYLAEELVYAFAALPSPAAWKAMPTPELMQLVSLNVPKLFYTGYHKHPGTAGKQLLQTFQDKFAVITPAYFEHVNFLNLSEAERRFIHRLDGQSRLSELNDDNDDMAPLLLTLTSLNMVRFEAAATAPATADQLPIRTLFNAIEEEVEISVEERLESFDDLVDAEEEMVDAVSTTSPATPTEQSPETDDLAQEVRLMAKSLEGQNHYEVFGIKQAKFSIDLLKERYFAVTRKFGPEVLMQLGGKDAALVEQILSTVATAYDTLSDVVKKERYDEKLGSDKIGLGREGDDKFQAEVQAESGKVFLEMEEWDNAEKALQEAVNFDPNNGDYLASLAWAIYRNPKYSGSQAMLNKSKQMLNKAITMERTAQGFAYKGWILFEAGQDSLAESEFNKALKLDARQMMARKGLRTIQEQREQQKKGLFKRMFK